MSLVTAAIEKRPLKALHSSSISAVFPDPTGLHTNVRLSTQRVHRAARVDRPSNTNGECAFVPVAIIDNRRFTSQVRPWTIKDLVGMAMVMEFMRVVVKIVRMVMGVARVVVCV